MTTIELTETPQCLEGNYRIRIVKTQTTGDTYMGNNEDTFSVLPVYKSCPKDSLATTKHQSSIRHYDKEIDMPLGSHLWGWLEFGGYEMVECYEVRGPSGWPFAAETLWSREPYVRTYASDAEAGNEPVPTITFDEYFVDNLRANNFFGSDGGEHEVIGLWMDALPYNQGDEVPEEEFNAASLAALEVAITRWNAGGRI